MMEFWLEGQGQSQLYSRHRTLPGRHYAHNYHERDQESYRPLYYEQQTQAREPKEWTVPVSRAGGALPAYTNWTQPELFGSSSPNFPFILHRYDQHHRDLGEYRRHNPTYREWLSQGAVRDSDRGFLRDAWPKKSHLSHNNRDVSTKRNDSSYRELEAWAARYSHSLPRRTRLEAELREAVQGLSESSQFTEREKIMTNPQIQQQHGQLNRNSRASGLWDKAQPHGLNANYMKEKIEYQSRAFDKPPGYIRPPPYTRPNKTQSVIPKSNVCWQLDSMKQADCLEPEKTESRKHEQEALQAPSPLDTQTTEDMLAQEPQADQKSSMMRDEICKVIEGRKFRLKKKTGGMTVFCLVSRIASPSETMSLPVCPSKTSVQSTEPGEISKERQDNNQANKLTEDVDFRADTLKEQSNKRTLRCKEKVATEDNLQNNSVFQEKYVFERSVPLSVEPVLTKYPLWREPSFSLKAETESSKTNSLKQTSIFKQEDHGDVNSHLTNNKKKTQDISESANDMRGLMVIDTSRVVVKVEVIPSPMKEQVHYLDSTPNDESSKSGSNSQLYQEVTTDPSNKVLQRNEDPEEKLDPTLLMKQEYKDNYPVGYLPPSVFVRETLEQRAERILGIPLHGDKQQTEDEESMIDPCKEEQKEETKLPTSEQTLEDSAEHVEWLLVEKDKEIRNQLRNEEGKNYTDSQRPATVMTEDNNTETRIETSTQRESRKDSSSEFTCGETENEEHFDLINNSSLYINLSDSSIHQALDSEVDAQSAEVDFTPNSSSPVVQPHSPFPQSPDSLLSSNFSQDHRQNSPLLEPLFVVNDRASGAEPECDVGETSQFFKRGVNDESSVTEIKENLPHQYIEWHKRDDAPCSADVDSAGAEIKDDNLNIIVQQFRHAQTEGVHYAEEERDPQVANKTLNAPTITSGEGDKGNAITCETEDYPLPLFLPEFDLEEKALCKTEQDVILEPWQINLGLITGPLEQAKSERDTSPQSQLNTDILQNPQSTGECPDFPTSLSSSENKVLNTLIVFELSSPTREPDRDCVPLLETESPQSVDKAAVPVIEENTSDPFNLDSCEESSQLTTFISQEEDISPEFSPSSAHKRPSQYPNSLLDMVNRIRKHTAPDSESGDEEVSEPWDLSCLDVVVDSKSEQNFSNDEQAAVKDRAETGQADQQDKEPEGHAEEETLSYCSNVSEDTVFLMGERTSL